MTSPKPLPDVRPGQVWADNDWRNAGRTLRVAALITSGGVHYASCIVLTNPTAAQERLDAGNKSGLDRDTRGKARRIRLDRFRPTSTGYRLIDPEAHR